MDLRRRPLTVRLFVLPQDRKYLSLSQARDKALTIDWLAQPRPGKLDGDKTVMQEDLSSIFPWTLWEVASVFIPMSDLVDSKVVKNTLGL